MSTAAGTKLPDADADEGRVRGAVVMSATLGGAYVLLAGLYIAFSSQIAAQLSVSIGQLHRIELAKGLIFVLVTGLTAFGISYLFLRRIFAQEGRIKRQEKALAAAEGRAMVGIFGSSIAHDMGNLLTAIRINIHLLREELKNLGEQRAWRDLERATNDLGDLASRLAVIGREKNPDQFHMVDLAALVGKVASFAPSHARIRQCRLTTAVEGRPKFSADETMLSRMLLNLVLNAVDAAGKGGRVEIRVVQDQGAFRLEVHDNGPGIPPALRERVFDPFYTTKASGTGLGLLSVKVCAEEHDASVEILESDLGGACFRVTFPVPAPEGTEVRPV